MTKIKHFGFISAGGDFIVVCADTKATAAIIIKKDHGLDAAVADIFVV